MGLFSTHKIKVSKGIGNLGGIYQLTYFLALTLLAIVIAIFVFAVSLLGRAIESAAKIEREKIDERKRINTKEIERLQEDIDKAKEKGEIPDELLQKLDILKRNDKNFEKALQKIRKAPEALTVKKGVFYPSSFLILSLILCGLAWYLSNIEGLCWVWSFVPWILGLAAIGYSVCIVCKSLKLIQDVAVTSEEAWTAKIVQAFKIAQKDLEEEKRPEVTLTFKGIKFPLEIEEDSEKTIQLILKLTKGDFAQDVELHLGLPSGFEFLDAKRQYVVTDEGLYAKYQFIVLEFPTMMRGLRYQPKINIKSHKTAGNYKLVYTITGRNLRPGFNEHDVIVK